MNDDVGYQLNYFCNFFVLLTRKKAVDLRTSELTIAKQFRSSSTELNRAEQPIFNDAYSKNRSRTCRKATCSINRNANQIKHPLKSDQHQ